MITRNDLSGAGVCRMHSKKHIPFLQRFRDQSLIRTFDVVTLNHQTQLLLIFVTKHFSVLCLKHFIMHS